MTNLFKISILLIFLAIPFFFYSCIKEEFDPKKLDTEFVINPVVAAPLGYIHYELDEMLEDSSRSWEINVDEDGLINLVYEADIFSQQASEFLQFSEINHRGYVRNIDTLPLDLVNIPYPYHHFQTDTINFMLAGLPVGPDYTEIDSIFVNSLVIAINHSTQNNLRGSLIISSPKSGPGIYQKNSRGRWEGIAQAIPLDVQSPPNTLDNCKIILANNPPDVNLVPLIVHMRLLYSQGYILPGYSILNYSVTISNLDYSAIYGYLGKMNIPIPTQEIPIDFYTSVNEGTFNFVQPQLKFYFENSFGMPIQIITTELYATSNSGTRTDITGTGLPSEENVQIINYPTLEDFGKFAYDSITINQGDADISRALESYPASVTFGIEARTNPIENDAYNFISDESQLNVKAKLILPLYGYTNLMTVEDSMRFEFDDFFKNPPEEIKRLVLRLNFTNGFPVDIRTQIYFMDENYAVLDSVFDELHLIKAGTDINGDGRVEPLKNDPVEAEVSRTKIDNISRSRYLFLKGRLNTANSEIPESFRFYSYYFLDAYIGVVGDLELNSTGN